ncbi:MAG: hypothetical protein ACE364_08845 [Chlorobiota bacterium]
MSKILFFLALLLALVFFFFKGATNFILALTGLKKTKNKQAKEPTTQSYQRNSNDEVIFEKEGTKVFKGDAGKKKSQENQ